MNTITCETVRERWTDPKARPLFKGILIDSDGCCCAQGDVLRMCGVTDDDLRHMNQNFADKEVAHNLGISLFHSILLRQVNDSQDGCPERVLNFSDEGLGRILGPNWRSVIAFGEHMSAMTDAQWNAAWNAAWKAAWNAAGDAAWKAAWNAAGDAAWKAAWNAAWNAAGELVGWSKLTTAPYFLKFFGINDAKAFVDSAESRWPEGGAS